MLAAIRNIAKEQGLNDLAEEIHETLLVNKHKKNNEFYKFIPTNIDMEAFRAIIMGEDLSKFIEHKLYKAFTYFKKLIEKDNFDLKELKIKVTVNLAMVSIVLAPNDNPNLVFESLNFKGQPLEAVDLIRNHLFMHIAHEEQEEIYNRYWIPMEKKLGGNLTEFFRHFLMGLNINVKQSEIYVKFKEFFVKKEAIPFIKELEKYADLYARLLLLRKESNDSIQHRLERLNILEARTVYPFLLHIYNDYINGKVDTLDFVEIIKTIENYVIRRFVCGMDSKQMNKMFASLYNQIKDLKSSETVEELKLYLQLRGYPTNEEVKMSLLVNPLYGTGDRARKTKYILSGFEEGFGHKEKVDLTEISIEHIMPQTLTPRWKEDLGEDYESVYLEKLHLLGNLTLTGYNSGLSNESFDIKRKYYKNSNLQINRELAEFAKWDKGSIEKRTIELIEQFFNIWPYFGKELSKEDKITGSSPRTLTIKGKLYNVRTWRDVLEKTIMYIEENMPEKIQDILKEFPKTVSANEGTMRQPRKITNGLFIDTKTNSKITYKRCIDIFETAGNNPEDWNVEFQLKS